jgi:intracellular sulfur oxidation DsrE/DsrF family protein
MHAHIHGRQVLLYGFLVGLTLTPGRTLFAEDAAYRYYVDIAQITLEELGALFMNLTATLGGLTNGTSSDPIVVVLHGDEAGAFLRSNYIDNKPLADAAALLDAYGVIDLKMCATWMRNHAVTEADILPFIESVPYGPAEVDRLRTDGYKPAPRVKL